MLLLDPEPNHHSYLENFTDRNDDLYGVASQHKCGALRKVPKKKGDRLSDVQTGLNGMINESGTHAAFSQDSYFSEITSTRSKQGYFTRTWRCLRCELEETGCCYLYTS